MGNLVGAMTLSQRRVSDESEEPIKIKKQNSRELFYQGKTDPIVLALSKALDDPNTSPLSVKNRKSFEKSEI